MSINTVWGPVQTRMPSSMPGARYRVDRTMREAVRDNSELVCVPGLLEKSAQTRRVRHLSVQTEATFERGRDRALKAGRTY